MAEWRLDSFGNFSISDFQTQRPFSSFLPGLAGPTGVPTWVFYVNRGQGIASFGVESKDSPLLEFQPANRAYQQTPLQGFRTFLRLERGGAVEFCEPFAAWERRSQDRCTLTIGANDLSLSEIRAEQGIRADVLYFTPAEEPFGALIRQLTLTNLGKQEVSVELLDGLPALIPFGVNNALLKEMGRTLEAWMVVENVSERCPFYKLRASVADSEEISTVASGHFAFGFVASAGAVELLPALVDPICVFGNDTSLHTPARFQAQRLGQLVGSIQVTTGRTPCALFAHRALLRPGESLALSSVYGHARSREQLPVILAKVTAPGYVALKHRQAVELVRQLTAPAETHSGHRVFDAYCRQNLLDNALRGGLPALLGNDDKRHVYYLYSRKHGDLERDYNAFRLAAEPYSQGEGSYRDINQNRRDNVFFEPGVGAFDVLTFLSLLQADGYNPRAVSGFSFSLPEHAQRRVLSSMPSDPRLAEVLQKPFTPGGLLRAVEGSDGWAPQRASAFVDEVLALADQHLEASYHEGYWVDHWVYNLDLIDSYLSIFPDRREELLFRPHAVKFFDSPAVVVPRSSKYVLTANGPRQYGSVRIDAQKAALIASRNQERNWARIDRGNGAVFRTSVFAKLLILAAIKFSSLDPEGLGIEMEAGRPGWYDALNGLPSLFGSSMPEAYELSRLLTLLQESWEAAPSAVVQLPIEAALLLRTLYEAVGKQLASGEEARNHRYWEAASSARELYRESTRLGFDGEQEAVQAAAVLPLLSAFRRKVDDGIARATALNGGLPPTYLSFTPTAFVPIASSSAPANEDRQRVRVLGFALRVLPPFLEGPVKALRWCRDRASALDLYRRVRESDLFDRTLEMYKVNASLEAEPLEIGRTRAFPRGWLENESIWLHMAYKYLLETLRAGLLEEFFADMRTGMVPFLEAAKYGRSTLENASFIVSTAHVDTTLHGCGFTPRLTGSTRRVFDDLEIDDDWRRAFLHGRWPVAAALPTKLTRLAVRQRRPDHVLLSGQGAGALSHGSWQLPEGRPNPRKAHRPRPPAGKWARDSRLHLGQGPCRKH